ncbi:hypothetical protein BH23GEM6_BH23GEM6_01480 [soil metagenome]
MRGQRVRRRGGQAAARAQSGRAAVPGTSGAGAIQSELMRFDDEALLILARGNHHGTGLQIEHQIAYAAVEMMVVAEARCLITGLSTRQDHRLNAISVQKKLEGAIHGRDAEILQLVQGLLVNLVDRERTRRTADHRLDDLALTGAPLAERLSMERGIG